MQPAVHATPIETIKPGDTEASYTLWQSLRPIWKRWAQRTHLPGLEREDLEQQSYLILLESLDKFDPEAGLGFHAYYKVRLHIWRGRVARRYTPLLPADTQMAELLEQWADPTDTAQIVAYHSLLADLVAYIQTLRPRDAQLLTALCFTDQNATQVAQQLGLTPANVRYRKKQLLAPFKALHEPPH